MSPASNQVNPFSSFPRNLSLVVILGILLSAGIAGEVCAEPVIHSAVVSSAGGCILEARVADSARFLPVLASEGFPLGTLFRTRPDFRNPLATPSHLLIGASSSIHLWPGTVLRVQGTEVTLLLGRIRMKAADEPNHLQIVFWGGRFHFSGKEAFAELDRDQTATFAVRRGQGWLKDQTRAINVIKAGFELSFPRFGKPSAVVELSRRWNKAFKDFAHREEPVTESSDETASAALSMDNPDALSSDTPTLASPSVAVNDKYTLHYSAEELSGLPTREGQPASGPTPTVAEEIAVPAAGPEENLVPATGSEEITVPGSGSEEIFPASVPVGVSDETAAEIVIPPDGEPGKNPQ